MEFSGWEALPSTVGKTASFVGEFNLRQARGGSMALIVRSDERRRRRRRISSDACRNNFSESP
jgi:hypothetical protein